MISEEFKRMGVLERVHWHRPNLHPKSGRVGCFESHLAVFKAAVRTEAAFAVVCEDDVRFSEHAQRAIERLLELVESRVAWRHASLQNSGGEVLLTKEGDDQQLPEGVRRGAFYFTRCYAITRAAMEAAILQDVTAAHVDVALAVANWGGGFIIRPAAALDVPSESNNDWAEGGWGPWMAGKMQGVTHLPCVIADRWKTEVLPRIMSQETLEAIAWKKFMDEPGASEHVNKDAVPKAASMKRSGCCWT